MDKNKNRTDLLAAGRKKLQQFRQKKDTKGNNSKSSGKSNKSGRGATADAATEAKAAQQNVVDGESSRLGVEDNVASSESISISRVDSVTSDDAAASDSHSANAGTLETAPPEETVEASEGLRGDESRPNQSTDGQDTAPGSAQKVESEDDAIVRMEETVDSSTSTSVGFSSQTEQREGEEQVTDVGAMQEVGSSCGNQIDKSEIAQLEGGGNLPNDFIVTAANNMITELQDSHNIDAACQGASFTKSGDASLNDVEGNQAKHDQTISACPVGETEALVAVSSETNEQLREGVSSGLLNEKKTETACCSGDATEEFQGGAGLIDSERSLELQTVDTASVGCKQVDMSSGLNGTLIELSQLADILQILDEDEFRFLFKKRKSSIEKFQDTDKVNDIVPNDAFEHLKEHLYVTHFTKDVMCLQLSEHQKLIDEISIANGSLGEVQGKNKILTEEIELYKYELQEVVSMREELQKQLYLSRSQVQGHLAQVNELQNKLEATEHDRSSLSVELLDCRNLVEALQSDKENLSGSLETIAEEKQKLLEDNNNFLVENEKLNRGLARYKASLEALQKEFLDLTENITLVRDDRRQLEEEKDYIVHENGKLLADLADCNRENEVLKGENKNLNEKFASMLEEREKMEEEKESVVHHTETLSKELLDCRDLVASLQMEISNLNRDLKSTTDEKNQFEEEKNSYLGEFEKQLQEVVEIRVTEASLRAGYRAVVDDLKEETRRLHQLSEENENLKISLEFHKSNVKESDQRSNLSQYEDVSDTFVEKEIQKSKSEPDWPSLEQLELDGHDDSSGFVALRRHLEDAGILMERIERAIEDVRLHSASLGGPNEKGVASGVSRLIQAFESKTHADDHDPENIPSGTLATNDLHMISKKVAESLRALLKDIMLDAHKVSGFCKGAMQNKLLADTAATELRYNYDSLLEHTDKLEEANMELMVLYEAVRENIHQSVAEEGEFRVLCDVLQNQVLVLKSENSKLSEKVNVFQVKISELQSQLDETKKNSEQMIASISNQVQSLQTELEDRESVLEEQWNSVVAQVLQTVGELDSIVKTSHPDSSSEASGNLDVVSYVAASVEGATKLIEVMHRQIEAAEKDHKAISDAYNEMHERSGNLQLKNVAASNALRVLYNHLRKLVNEPLGSYSEDSENVLVDYEVLELSNPDSFNTLLEHLKNLIGERLQLDSAIKELNSELMERAKEINELERYSLKPDTIFKLVGDVEETVGSREIEIHSDEPASLLESMVYLLVQKYNEASQGLSSCASLERQLSDLRGQVEDLNFVLLQYENENLVFKQSLKSAEIDLVSLNSKMQEKVAELEQSEQRVLLLREKLSIAVTKGKGLISQRDSLKHSLAETSRELEKCSQELLSKDASLHELETKLKVYAEAGERMEALKSELSYIRNSATALRESFLLKDSTLQRIEEILEDLEVPEHFHSRDIVEKIEWLAKSVTGNSLPSHDWDQRKSEGGGSYSDAGFVGGDGLKEDFTPDPYSGDLRRRYEELQSRFYELAEQNEMLEQSLMERNNLVRRWEEILDRVDIPSQMRMVEPEAKIQWLGSALLEAQDQCSSLQEKIDNLETHCGSVTADVEDSRRRISELDVAFQEACREREILRQDNDENTKKIADLKIRNEHLQNELSMLQEQMLRMEEDMHHTEGAIGRLQQIVKVALEESDREEEVVIDQVGVNFLEEMLKSFVEKYKILSSGKPMTIDPIDVHGVEKGELPHISRDSEEQDLSTLSKKLEDSMNELQCLKEEKDRYMLNLQSLNSEVEALEKKKIELQELLNQEELKSASLREKLNVAVRKGKSLVQLRDSMKQVIEELNAEVERLKSETKINEKVISEYENQMKGFSATRENLQNMEAEIAFLRNQLSECESCLQEKERSWQSIVDALEDVKHVDLPFNSPNPIERLRQIGNVLHELGNSVDSAEQESRKSKRAAELLLAELNEVQERNDCLQEELAKAAHELSELSREKDLAETAKFEALAHVEKLSYAHSEEQNRQLSEFMLLKSGVDQMREDLVATERELAGVLAKDLEVLHSVESKMKSFTGLGSPPHLNAPLAGGFTSGVTQGESENKVFAPELGSLKERLYNHSQLFYDEACRLSEVVMNVHAEFTSQKGSYESAKRDAKQLELTVQERESELRVLRGNISLLFEACTSAILEIENWKSNVVGNGSGKNAKSQVPTGERQHFTNDNRIFTEDGAREMHNKLLFAIKDFTSTRTDFMEDGLREMKITLLNLQRELQEKDIQRDRICKELVNQIKEAEANADNYLHDLKQVRAQLHDLRRQVVVMNDERELVEKRMKELQDQEANSAILQQKINSLTDAIAAKEQESEALMQALDEEEAQMEDLANKNRTLVDELQKKNQELENLEASRAKALKKLSVTVSKFDELHYLSENLLSEVEKLQSQLQDRNGEISFLRQEVTRCTNDALAATQMSKKRTSDEIQDFFTWLDSLISRIRPNEASESTEGHQVTEYKEILQKQIMSLISELENLRLVSQSSDILLREERSKVEELAQKGKFLENSLREKESQIVMLQGAGDSAKATTSEIVEVEPLTNKWASTGTLAPQVRSLRKANNDQIAITIDEDHQRGRLEDEDDDKAHGFKSLTTSKIVPRFTRPVSDLVDGLWVSCDRALMRQPALRLGVILYWAVLHALLATFVV